MSTENNVLEITDAEQGQQRSENNELRKQLIEDGNQLQMGVQWWTYYRVNV